jgi:hypothetical protein
MKRSFSPDDLPMVNGRIYHLDLAASPGLSRKDGHKPYRAADREHGDGGGDSPALPVRARLSRCSDLRGSQQATRGVLSRRLSPARFRRGADRVAGAQALQRRQVRVPINRNNKQQNPLFLTGLCTTSDYVVLKMAAHGKPIKQLTICKLSILSIG